MPQRNAVQFNVYLNGIGSSLLQPIDIEESAGSDRLDIATLEYVNSSLQDLNIASLMNLEVEIERVDNAEVVHWGKVTQLPVLLSGESGETLEVVSRTELYHLGGQVDGYLVWNPIAAAYAQIDGDLVFNPMIDGVIYGNKNDTHTTGAGCLLFLDPESVRTSAAQTLQGANVAVWSLADAVFYLLWALNTPQTYISNPSAGTLAAVFSDPAALVQEVRIPRGTHLPKALDILLEPLGYRWKVKRTALGARQYFFWKKGTDGTLKTLAHQSSGTALENPRNLADTEVELAGITYDISNLANEIWVRGGFEEYEITVELARGWKSASDPSSGTDIMLYSIKDNANFDNVRDVMRKWVLNEAGDYIGTRAEITGVFTSALRTSLTSLSLLNHFVPRRRKLMPALSLKPAVVSSVHDLVPIGDLNGIEVEYSNTATPAWKPIGGCSVLEQEAGIYFHEDKLPDEFFEDIANLRVRVTATIQGDYRLTGSVAHQANSPNTDIVPLTLDLPDRFRYRVRHSSLSKYGGGAVPSLAVNDTTAIAAFATYVRNAFDLMDISGPIQIEGLDNSYTVGDRVKDIQVKNISFLCRTSSGAYPQIVAIERNIEQQLMTLHLERQRDVIQLPPAPQGNSPRFRTRHSGRDFV